ncbi:Actin-like protein arp9 (SWI/SNF complex component arp9) [Lignoscripta atroalba]|nr:Actin-like protein arp9 (SWI/SNF complex component arp9) [Lignoscripta atroalba]
MPPFKDEHILIIAPGTQTTLAQLGLPESFTPARLRISTRMFPAEKKGEWEPLKVREKKIRKPSIPDITLGKDGQDDPLGGPNGTMNGEGPKVDDAEEETLYEEDSTSEEGAVFPLKDGRVVNWSCFFALLTHVYNTLSPPFHTPILVIAQPAWTEQDHETLTQFFFEKFKTPAFCLMDSALAVCYAFGVPTATVVDVGYGKCDVTAVNDFLVNDIGRGIALHGCGGEGMTQRLLDLLSSKGFTRDMCEQLKKSTISEILPPGTDLPTGTGTTDNVTNPAAVASTGAIGSGSGQRVSIAAQGGAPRGPGLDTDVGDDDHDREIKDGEDNDGVLDVASIVASGKTSEFLAKKEREKAERAAAKKAAVDAAAAPKAVRLPNSKREKAILHYEERRPLEELNGNGKRAADGDGTQEGGESKRQKTPEPVNEATDGPAPARKEERRRNRANATFVRKDVEVGIERFKAADGGILDQIADSIHRSILSVPEVNKRSELWDSLIILGNGSKVRGFKDALLSTLHTKYLISPSSATIFTSELPSNLSTPLATGANTPLPQPQPSHHGGGGSSGVNPLLLAATTASNPTLAPPPNLVGHQHLHSQLQLQQYHQHQQSSSSSLLSSSQQQQQQQHSSHGQTPTSIKCAKMPEYFSEWKDVGTEEAAFLGAQVAAKVIFVVDQGLSKGFMSRTEYNELGPQGIHESCL